MADKVVTTSNTNKDFDYWSSAGWLTGNTRRAVRDTDILVVPREGFRDYTGPVFPVGTADLFQHLKGGVPPGTHVEIAIDDSDFKELAVHADIVTVATILVKYVAAPVVVGLVVDYLKKRLGARFSNGDVHASLIVEQREGDRHKSVQISYDGPAPTFETSVKAALDSIFSPHQLAGNRLIDPPDSTLPHDNKT